MRATIAMAWEAAAMLVAALGCRSAGAGGLDAAAEGAPMASDLGDASSYDAAAAACLEAGGQCQAGAVCALFQSPQVCGPGGAMCCLQVVCSANEKVKLIQASDYDQSCTSNSDCVEVYVGNTCTCEIGCRVTPAAINRSAEPQYEVDVAEVLHVPCSCTVRPPFPDDAFPVPCCVGGKCQFTQCSSPVAVVDAAADTGADAATDTAADASGSDAADAAGE